MNTKHNSGATAPDKRKKYYIILDTETTNEIPDQLAYDLGFAVTDKKGNIYETYSFVINDIFFDNKDLMQTAYYAKKIPQYYQGIKDKQWQVCSLYQTKKIIQEVMQKYNIDTVLAYNMAFDRKALTNTQRYITKSKYRYYFPYDTKFECIWHMACQVICTQKTYLRWAIANNKLSPSGRYISTNAETVYQYLSSIEDFEEQHTGLADVMIETTIFAHCLRQHKTMDKSINTQCWRLPTQKAKELNLF